MLPQAAGRDGSAKGPSPDPKKHFAKFGQNALLPGFPNVTESPRMPRPTTCIADLQALAKRRVPRMFYDYADSGSWTEGTYRANEEDFQKIKLRQRVAVDMRDRTLASTMVGHSGVDAGGDRADRA